MKIKLSLFKKISSWNIKIILSFLIFILLAASVLFIVNNFTGREPIHTRTNASKKTIVSSLSFNSDKIKISPTLPQENINNVIRALAINKDMYLSCMGPDNKIAKSTKKDCDALKAYWKSHPPPQAASLPSASDTGSGGSSSSTSTITSTPSPTPTPTLVPLGWFGTNMSGQEFNGSFQANSLESYTYFKNKGFNTIRLPFLWDELQPDLYSDFDSTEKGYIDQNISWAKANGLNIILDMHNYGRRYVYLDGGFSDDFANSTQRTFRMPYGDHDAVAATITIRDFGRAKGGTINNPVSPAGGYVASFSAAIVSTSGQTWNSFYINPYYIDDNNNYRLVINSVQSTWTLQQVIGGVTTTLASGSKTWTLGQFYTFEVDVNQTTSGKINVKVDSTNLYSNNSINTSPSLTHGYFSFYPSGTKVKIKGFTLNVAGDTTSGGPQRVQVTDTILPIAAWQDFWTRLSQYYKDESTVVAYDHNEPHDMNIPTNTGNYSAAVASANNIPTATTTVIYQKMLDAIRANGDSKYIVVEMDSWANTHRFATLYGTNASPWVIDTLNPAKVIYSGHYYFDSDHSGVYADNNTPSDSLVISEVTPFFSWCNNRRVYCYIGEYGVPNTSIWQASMTNFLNLMHQYGISSTQWAGGNAYSSITTLQPTSSFTVDRLQMTTIQNFLNSL